MEKEHLAPKMTNRGFMHMPEVESTYKDSTVRVYESSAAMGPHVWIMAAEPGKDKDVAVHLTLEDAIKFAEQIQYLAKNHYQVREEGPTSD